MEPIQISIRLPRNDVLPGERLLVRTALRNTGGDPVSVPDFNSPTKILYELVPADPHRQRYLVSYEILRRSLGGMPEKAEPAPEMTLAGGSWLTREEDIASLSFEPFTPGDYQLIARFLPDGEHGPASAPVQVHIVAPDVAHFALGVSQPEQVARSVLVHRAPSGLMLLERESRSDPRRGVFFRRSELPADRPVLDVAVSTDVEQIVGGHWYAWLDAGRVSMQRCWGSDVEHTASASTGLSGMRLGQPGLQEGDTAGLFLAIGSTGNECLVQAWQTKGDVCSRLWQSALGAQDVPDRVAVSYAPGRIVLVWLEGAVNIRSREFDRAGKPAEEKARTLARFDEPVIAWEVAAAAESLSHAIHVVTEAESGYRYTAHRVSLAGAAPATGAAPARFQALDKRDNVHILATMAPRDERFPVLAQIDGRLMVARVESGSGWMDLGPVRWPHGKWLLFAPARAIWVGCLSAEAGFVCWPLSGR